MSSKPKGGARAAKVSTGEAEPEKPEKSDMIYAHERIGSATGTSEKELQDRLLNQVLAGVRVRQGHSEDGAIMATIFALEALAPADGAEGMLAAQMVATHEAAMECLGRAARSEQTFEGRDMNLKHAEKLMQIYARQLEVLDKRKGRGQQKITVEHVTVEAGGQAIMGDVHLDKKGAPSPGLALLTDTSVTPLDPALLRPREFVPARARKKRSE